MASLLVELNCPKHGFERFKIKIMKKFNMEIDAILLEESRKGEIKSLVVGRKVSNDKIKAYITDYFCERDIIQHVLRMKLLL